MMGQSYPFYAESHVLFHRFTLHFAVDRSEVFNNNNLHPRVTVLCTFFSNIFLPSEHIFFNLLVIENKLYTKRR